MKKITQAHIAREVHVTAKYLNDIFQRRKTPSPRLAIRLEAVTGVPRAIWVFEPEKIRLMLAKRKKPAPQEAA